MNAVAITFPWWEWWRKIILVSLEIMTLSYSGSRASQGALVVKSPSVHVGGLRDMSSVPGLGDPLKEDMGKTHSSIPAWRIPRTEEPGRATVHGVTKSQTKTKETAHKLHYQIFVSIWKKVYIYTIFINLYKEYIYIYIYGILFHFFFSIYFY